MPWWPSPSPTIDGLRVDDPVGAVSVHGVCGALGTLWVGLAATDGGLFHGGGFGLLGTQVVGILAVTAWVGAATAVLFSVLKALGQLRVSPEEEMEGLDVLEHGVSGYAPDVLAGAGSGRPTAFGFEAGTATATRAATAEP